MGQPTLPMYTRVGNTALWQSSLYYKAAATPFYQERALNEYLINTLLFETNYDKIWRDFYLYNLIDSELHNAIIDAHTDILVQSLVFSYPVIHEEIEGFDYRAHAVVRASTALFLNTRVYRLKGIMYLQKEFFNIDEDTIGPKVRYLELADELLEAWCSTWFILDNNLELADKIEE